MSEPFSKEEFARFQAFLAAQGIELPLIAPKANEAPSSGNQTSTKSALQPVEQPVKRPVKPSTPNPTPNSAPNTGVPLITKSATAKKPAATTKSVATDKPAATTKPAAPTKPVTMTKPVATEKPVATTKPPATTKLAAKSKSAASAKSPTRRSVVHPWLPYSPYQTACPVLLAVPSPKSKSRSAKLVWPMMKLKFMKKPKGTPGRKKNGWPEPMKVIFGTTPAQFRFISSTIKCLVFKKCDTTICLTNQEGDNVTWVIQKAYKFVPEFKIYKGDWPIRAFMQVILKSANDMHRKITRRLNNPDDPDAALNMPTTQAEAIANAVSRMIDKDASKDKDANQELCVTPTY